MMTWHEEERLRRVRERLFKSGEEVFQARCTSKEGRYRSWHMKVLKRVMGLTLLEQRIPKSSKKCNRLILLLEKYPDPKES